MKPSILIAATHPQQCTGYARVGCTLANGLAERGWRVHYWAYQNLAPESQRHVHPEVEMLDVAKIVGEPLSFGEHVLPETIESLKPDVVLLYNDVMVLNRFLDRICKFVTGHRFPVHRPKIVSYLDLVHDNEHAGMVRGVVDRSDRVWVFSEHWKRHAFSTDDTIDVIPHGIDPSLLEAADSVSQSEARKALGFPEDAFLVVNTNRNSYRKALDLSIEGFLRFWKSTSDDGTRKCLILNNNSTVEGGYDIPHLVHTCCVRLGICDIEDVMSNMVLGFQNGGFIADRHMAYLYKAASAGLNSCLGEGFGLCQLEGACIGVPQVATATGGLIDMLQGDNGHVLVDPSIRLTLPRAFVDHSGTLDIPDPKDIAAGLEAVYTQKTRAPDESMRTRHDWTAILDRSDTILRSMVV